MKFHSRADRLIHIYRHYLESNDKDGELQRTFTSETPLESMFQYIWDCYESNRFLKIPQLNADICTKGCTLSEKFRVEGNRLYKEKKFPQSLEAYNLCILVAPFPRNGEEPSLSLGYANRSALLYQIDQFEAAIQDIDRALKTNYPSDKITKLYDRKVKCLLHLNRFNEAEDMLVQGKLEKLQDALKIDPKRCGAMSKLFYTGPFQLPLVKDAIKVHRTPEKGRHLIATTNLQPGEILLCETTQACVVSLDRNLRTHCAKCLQRTPIVLPCPNCSLVAFCSEECQQDAITPLGMHYNECSVLPLIVQLQPDINMVLVFRKLCSSTLQDFQKTVKLEDTSGAKKQNQLLEYNLNMLMNLEGNISKRSFKSLMEATMNAFLLIKLLMKIPRFFGQEKTISENFVAENYLSLMTLGADVLKLILNFQCNSHLIKELVVQSQKSLNSCWSSTIGHGVFCNLTLVNHSCSPNVLTSNLGSRKFMYTIKSIAAGEEIVDSYGERFVSHAKVVRQKNLLHSYYFECSCVACVGNWPLFEELATSAVLKCYKCGMEFSDSKGTCSCVLPKNRKKKKQKGDTAAEAERKVSTSWRKYEDAMKQLSLYQSTETTLHDISQFILTLEKYTKVPNKPYIEAQESLMRIFDLKGSQHYL